MTIIVVKKGDSLWEIATKNKVDPSRIIEVNGLDSAALVPGLALYIPNQNVVNRRYLIKNQENLSEIGSRFGTSAAAIMKGQSRNCCELAKGWHRNFDSVSLQKSIDYAGVCLPDF